MLTKPQLARFVHSSGVEDPSFAEKEVVLTYLLQLLVERGFIDRVVFKGGTCIAEKLRAAYQRRKARERQRKHAYPKKGLDNDF